MLKKSLYLFQQATGGIFGKTGFGTAATSTGLGFGQQNTGLFANKPATSNTGFNFGQTASTGFGTYFPLCNPLHCTLYIGQHRIVHRIALEDKNQDSKSTCLMSVKSD